MVPKHREAPAQEPARGNIVKQIVFVFGLRMIEHDPLPRAEEEDISVRATATGVHVHVAVDVIGSQATVSHAANKVRREG